MNDGRAGMGQGPTGTPSVLQPNRGISTAPSAPGLRPPSAGISVPPTRPLPAREEPLELVSDDKPTTEAPKSKIHGISSASSLVAHTYKRPTHSNKTGSVRMKTFHCRLSEQGVEYLDQSINDWLEGHPDIEVKFTTSTVGMWDGKLKEPALILNVWY
jgi:hypothetical protein